MGWKKCGQWMHGHGGHGKQFPMPPCLLLIPLSVAVSAVVGVMLKARQTRALEAMAMAQVLDEMKDQLSEDERKELEARIRLRVFYTCGK